MVANFVFPPEFILAEDRTTTEVIGKPPKNPLIILPIP